MIHSRKEQRYRCTACGQTFAATRGTPFYRLHRPAELLVTVVTLLAYGCPVQAIVAAFGLDERTVWAWQARAGEHGRGVHAHLVEQPRDLGHVQADEIRVKGQGVIVWLALAIQVSTRLWLGGVASVHRDADLIRALVGHVRACALARPLLICVDGLSLYVEAARRVFRSRLETGRRGQPRLLPWPAIHLAQVIKQHVGRRVVGVLRRVVQGSLAGADALLAASQGGTQFNTAFIERLNATFRSRLAPLARRSRALLRRPGTLEPLVYLMGCVYNFCTPHASLRLPGLIGGHTWIPRTPALAAGLTDHIWTVQELLRFRVPPPLWKPTYHQGRPSNAEKAVIAKWCR